MTDSPNEIWMVHLVPDAGAVKYILVTAELKELIEAMREFDKGGPGYGDGERQLAHMIQKVRLYARSLPHA